MPYFFCARLRPGTKEGEEELHNKPAHTVPLASARQHPENQKESGRVAGGSVWRVVGVVCGMAHVAWSVLPAFEEAMASYAHG